MFTCLNIIMVYWHIMMLACQQNPNSFNTQAVSFNPTRLFGFVARKQGSTTDNVSHLFAELDPDQPASAIVSFTSKMMKRWNPPTSKKWQWPFWHLPSLHRCLFRRDSMMSFLFVFCFLSVVVCFCFPLSFFTLHCWFVLTLVFFEEVSVLKGLVLIQSGARGCVVWSCERDKLGGCWREEKVFAGWPVQKELS